MRTVAWTAAALTFVALVALAGVRKGLAQDEKPRFVGDKSCQKCHFQQHKAWRKTGLATAVSSLQPTPEDKDKRLFDRKKEAGLDPAKDYSTDAKCLKCHTTGFGTESGFPADPKASDDCTQRAATFANVGCESCHGAGSLYVKHKTETLEKDKTAKFTFESMAKFGLVKPDEALCKTCHNVESPTKEDFKFEDEKTKVHPTKKTADK